MNKILLPLITIAIISISSSAYPIASYKVYPDYEISASLSAVIETSIIPKWNLNIKIRDAAQKKYVKAWDKTDENPAVFDLSGTKELPSFSKTYTATYENVYQIMIESIFKIAMQIQDAGLIPVIKFGKIDQIDNEAGKMFHPTDKQPSGTWSSKRRYTYVKTYFPDYYVSSWIKPVMSNDKLSVISWTTEFQIAEVIGHEMSVWSDNETDVLQFDLTEPEAYTKSSFTFSSSSWLEAQKIMFQKTHMIIARMMLLQPDVLVEAKYGDINFTSTNGVKLIDLSDGILPDGTFIDKPPVTPLSAPTQTAPADNTQGIPRSLILTWQPVPGATKYYLQINKGDMAEPGFASSPLQYTVTGTHHIVSGLLASTGYFWRVRAENYDPAQTSEYSSIMFFKTGTQTDLAYPFIRIRATDRSWTTEPNNEYGFGIKEIRLYTGSNETGTEFIGQCSTFASSDQQGYERALATDWNYGSLWWTSIEDSKNKLGWFAIQNNPMLPLGTVVIMSDQWEYGIGMPKSFVVEGSTTSDFSNSLIIKTFNTLNAFTLGNWWVVYNIK